MSTPQFIPATAPESHQLEAVRNLITERIGLELGEHNTGLVDKAIREHMVDVGEADPHAYARTLATRPVVLEELGQKLTVLESWFFRDEGPFEFLAHLARTEWLHLARRLRVLSLPCACGEEPYSIAMALVDAGFPPERFSIDAVDVNEVALDRARRGLYGNYAFRSRDLRFRDRYFTPVGNEFQLRRNVRDMVRFGRGNVLDTPLPEQRSHYDVVFCRNLLIYLNAEAKLRCLENIGGRLVFGGYLFVGAAEAGHIDGDSFVAVRARRCFAFRKPSPVEAVAQRPGSAISGRYPGPSARPPRPATGPGGNGRRAHAAVTRTAGEESGDGATDDAAAVDTPLEAGTSDAGATLLQARDLANRGDLAGAADLVHECIAADAAAAEAYSLLGVVHMAGGDDDDAEAALGKAVYLDPEHHEALVHLSLLAAKRGDEGGAERFRRRAEKAASSER